jgi:hypothetical protein
MMYVLICICNLLREIIFPHQLLLYSTEITKIGVKFNTNFCYFRTIVEITPAFIKYHYSGMVSKLRIDSVFVYWYIQFFIVNLLQFFFFFFDLQM